MSRQSSLQGNIPALSNSHEPGAKVHSVQRLYPSNSTDEDTGTSALHASIPAFLLLAGALNEAETHHFLPVLFFSRHERHSWLTAVGLSCS